MSNEIENLPTEVKEQIIVNIFALLSACELIEEMRGNKLGTSAYSLAGVLAAAWGKLEVMSPNERESIGDAIKEMLEMTLQFKRG